MGIAFTGIGEGFASDIIGGAATPLIALFIGILATSVMQSSSATTSIIVGLVATGILDLTTAIPMLMGANIGTSVTSTITSMAHISNRQEFGKAFSGAVLHDFFNIFTVIILFPIEITFHVIENTVILASQAFGGVGGVQLISPISLLVKPVAEFAAELLSFNAIAILVLSLIVLFGSLNLIIKIMKSFVKESVQGVLHTHFFKNKFTAFATGAGLTVLVQSSSITTSAAVPFVGTGALSLKKIFPFVLGANIGTTITAFLAALVIATPLALSVALAHLMFNILGIIIVYPIRRAPIFLAKLLGNIAEKYRRIAVGYTLTMFFILPAAVIFFIK